PTSTLAPYTTLFRSPLRGRAGHQPARRRGRLPADGRADRRSRIRQRLQARLSRPERTSAGGRVPSAGYGRRKIVMEWPTWSTGSAVAISGVSRGSDLAIQLFDTTSSPRTRPGGAVSGSDARMP